MGETENESWSPTLPLYMLADMCMLLVLKCPRYIVFIQGAYKLDRQKGHKPILKLKFGRSCNAKKCTRERYRVAFFFPTEKLLSAQTLMEVVGSTQ